uniref:Uncharacterized protein n=1 Tax=Soybean thrips nege-like virus 2 TaxID=2801041 RepID=A0A7T8E828_9VIRU|nr:hypothetical protein [Soybean thrips nege-like virus 2]
MIFTTFIIPIMILLLIILSLSTINCGYLPYPDDSFWLNTYSDTFYINTNPSCYKVHSQSYFSFCSLPNFCGPSYEIIKNGYVVCYARSSPVIISNLYSKDFYYKSFYVINNIYYAPYTSPITELFLQIETVLVSNGKMCFGNSLYFKPYDYNYRTPSNNKIHITNDHQPYNISYSVYSNGTLFKSRNVGFCRNILITSWYTNILDAIFEALADLFYTVIYTLNSFLNSFFIENPMRFVYFFAFIALFYYLKDLYLTLAVAFFIYSVITTLYFKFLQI